MSDETTVFGLEPDQLIKLMKTGSQDDPTEPGQKTNAKHEYLCERLAEPLPLEDEKTQTLPPVLEYLSPRLKSLAGETLQNLIQNPKTDIDLLKHIKGIFKPVAAAAKDQVQQQCAGVIVHAAIAHALVFHQQKISKYSYEKLENSFNVLAQKTWLTPELIQLFEQAKNICQKKKR